MKKCGFGGAARLSALASRDMRRGVLLGGLAALVGHSCISRRKHSVVGRLQDMDVSAGLLCDGIIWCGMLVGGLWFGITGWRQLQDTHLATAPWLLWTIDLVKMVTPQANKDKVNSLRFNSHYIHSRSLSVVVGGTILVILAMVAAIGTIAGL